VKGGIHFFVKGAILLSWKYGDGFHNPRTTPSGRKVTTSSHVPGPSQQEQSLKIDPLVKEMKTFSEGSVKPVKKFEWRNCDFVTNSEIGLKQHSTKKKLN
jgi:hypothetical protein